MERQIVTTDDGSATIYLPALDEHYHSVKGALAESRHIYADTGYRHRAASWTDSGSPLHILEIGLGTGLNAAVTAMAAAECGIPVHYTAIELYPLTPGEIELMHYDSCVDSRLLRLIHDAPWGCPEQLTPQFIIEKLQVDFLSASLPDGIDTVYFDAFAPEKQPDMWRPENFIRLYDAMNPAGTLVTYCAKGAIRRQLQAAGFTVERLPGPPAGKREILRATKNITNKHN